MKKFIVILFTFFSLNIYSQVGVGVSVANDIENDISKLGMGLSYTVLPKVSLGAGVMITPFDIDGDYEIMLNIKYNLGRFNLAAGYMFDKMPDDHMGMHMGMDLMHNSDENHNEPYIGIDYKLFKNRKLRIFYNQSEMMKTIGIKTPIFKVGKNR